MERPLVAVVLAGGVGTRLYPATRSDRPKQFLSFGRERSLLTAAVERASFADRRYVLTRESFVDAVHDHAPDAAVLTEPAPKDTGPALVYAAHRIREQVGECILVVLPSDHAVSGEFDRIVRSAAAVAADTEGLVTMGIESTRPDPGYGYVEPGPDRGGYAPVETFHEKPEPETAREYVERGYYWNAGTFAWSPEALLSAARSSPLEALVEALEAGDPDGGFAAVEPVSVDHAILERAADVYVVPADVDWDDLGTWDALGRAGQPDESGNVALGDSLAIDASDNVVATDGHVSLVGVDGLVVASYGDRTLVVPRGESGRVREVVSALRSAGRF